MEPEEKDKNPSVEKPSALPEDARQQIEALKAALPQIAVAVLVVAAVIGGVVYFKSRSASQTEEAFTRLFRARTPQELDVVLTRYSSSSAAPLALLRLAKIQFNSGNYDVAMARYMEFKTKYPGHDLADVAEMGRIHCLEARNQLEESLKAFTDFTASRTNHFLQAEAILGRARCLEELGRNQEAKTVYEDFLAAHPDSLWTPRAEELLKSLKRKMEKPKPSA